MKILTQISFFALFLFGINTTVYATNQVKEDICFSQNKIEKLQNYFSNTDQNPIIIEDSENDFENDSQFIDENNIDTKTKLALEKNVLIVHSFTTISMLFYKNIHSEYLKNTMPFLGKNTPIYLKNSVLRI